MAQISSFGAFPDPGSHIAATSGKGAANAAQKTTASTPSSAATSDQTETSPLQAQLTRLSAVLNGLQQNANTNRAQYVQVLNQVKSGTYNVDSRDVSRSIVNDLLSDQ